MKSKCLSERHKKACFQSLAQTLSLPPFIWARWVTSLPGQKICDGIFQKVASEQPREEKKKGGGGDGQKENAVPSSIAKCRYEALGEDFCAWSNRPNQLQDGGSPIAIDAEFLEPLSPEWRPVHTLLVVAVVLCFLLGIVRLFSSLTKSHVLRRCRGCCCQRRKHQPAKPMDYESKESFRRTAAG